MRLAELQEDCASWEKNCGAAAKGSGGSPVQDRHTFIITRLRRKGLNATALKTFAAVTMLIDHITLTFLERTVSPITGGILAVSSWDWRILDLIGRGIGRQAFPIFAFFIAEGYCRTHSRGRYLGRLVLFAAISQLPFWLVCNTGPIGSTRSVSLNVYVTLALGLLVIWALDAVYLRPAGLGNGYFLTPGMQRCGDARAAGGSRGEQHGSFRGSNLGESSGDGDFREKRGGSARGSVRAASGNPGKCRAGIAETYQRRSAFELLLRFAAALAAAAVLCAAAELLNSDYGAVGVLAIVFFYLLRRYRALAVLAVWVLLGCGSSWLEWLALPGLLLLMLYNGERGGRGRGVFSRYGFYVFYPAHLVILWALRVSICGA